MYIFNKIEIVFVHLKLEIASAIPASKEEKYNRNNSDAHVLICPFFIIWILHAK